MFLIGCDFHPSWQQVCWLDRTTGEREERKLVHAPGEVECFYRQFPVPARIGMEATGNCQWFVEVVAALGHELWIGDAAKIRASDPRQLLVHRYKLVLLRMQAKNGLQHLALNQGLQKKRRLWSRAGQKLLSELPLGPWASRRREDLTSIGRLLDQQIQLLDLAVIEAAQVRMRDCS
jgi:transposase